MEQVMRIVADLDRGHRGRGAAVAGLQHHTVKAVRPSLLLLMGAVVLVLLISCANVSGLLLARGAARRREIALRLALGAASSRVLQQALIEGLVLALVGAAAGLLVAQAGIRVLVELGPALPLIKEATLDVRVLTFTILTAVATGVVFGIVPAVQDLKTQANDVLKEGGMRQAGGAHVSAMCTGTDRWRSCDRPHPLGWRRPLLPELSKRPQRRGRLRPYGRPDRLPGGAACGWH